MEFREVYCITCKKLLGRYNTKYYTDDKMGEILKSNHSDHVKSGHQIKIRVNES